MLSINTIYNMDKNLLRNYIKQQKENQNSFPSVPEMASNLVSDVYKNVKSVVQGNPLNVSQDDAEKRKAICENCTFFNKEQQRCTKCGCYMAVKVYLKASSCPVGKW